MQINSAKTTVCANGDKAICALLVQTCTNCRVFCAQNVKHINSSTARKGSGCAAPVYAPGMSRRFRWHTREAPQRRLCSRHVKTVRHVGICGKLNLVVKNNEFNLAAQAAFHRRSNKVIGNGGVLAQKRSMQISADAVAIQGSVAARIIVIAVAHIGNHLAKRLQGGTDLRATGVILVPHYRLRGKLRFQRDIFNKAIETGPCADRLQVEDGKTLHRFIAHKPIAAQNLVAPANSQEHSVVFHVCAQIFAHAQQNLGCQLLLTVGAATDSP